MTPFSLPAGSDRVRRVHSFHELVTTTFADGVNALCWPRDLKGDFGEVVTQFGRGEGIASLDEAGLRSLALSAAGRAAVEVLIADLRLLRDHGLAPVLDCIHGYPRDGDAEIVATDVYSFHADRAPVEADTYLCTYYGPTSEGLSNEAARRHVDIPATRAELLRQFGGQDDEAFAAYLADNCYDLHYAPATGAQPFAFGLGNLWRIAIDWPGSPVPPCIHRAPATAPGQARLLLIS